MRGNVRNKTNLNIFYIPDSNINIQAPLKNKKIPKQNSTEFPNALM